MKTNNLLKRKLARSRKVHELNEKAKRRQRFRESLQRIVSLADKPYPRAFFDLGPMCRCHPPSIIDDTID